VHFVFEFAGDDCGDSGIGGRGEGEICGPQGLKPRFWKKSFGAAEAASLQSLLSLQEDCCSKRTAVRAHPARYACDADAIGAKNSFNGKNPENTE
jgi:hypothetical protein